MDSEQDLLDRLRVSDETALNEALWEYRPRLLRMIQLRMDRRLKGRFDAADIVQDAYLEAARRLPDYLDDPRMPFFVWLRFIVGEHLLRQQRRHLGAAKRAADREISMFSPALPGASTAMLAARLVGKMTPPSRAAVREENRRQLERALQDLSDRDREVIAMRHFEQMSRIETAHALGINESACGKRYVRALQRLRERLEELGSASQF